MKFPFKKIDNIMKKMRNNYEDINRGGCGITAALIATHLEKLAKIRIVTYGGEGDVDKARHNVKNNSVIEYNIHDIRFCHVWVEFRWKGRWYTIDSDGIRKRSDMYKKYCKPSKGHFTVEEMNEIGGREEGWNSMFDRDQIPNMKRMLERNFNKLIEQV